MSQHFHVFVQSAPFCLRNIMGKNRAKNTCPHSFSGQECLQPQGDQPAQTPALPAPCH